MSAHGNIRHVWASRGPAGQGRTRAYHDSDIVLSSKAVLLLCIK